MLGARTPTALLIALVLVACGDEPPVAGEPPPADLVPGPVTQGLCLSARLDARRGLIRYAVENVGAVPFRYTHRHFGDLLEVRREGEAAWRALPRRPDAIRIVSGMGPMRKDVRVLAPGEALPRDAFYSVVDQMRFTPAGEPRPGLDVPQAPEPFTLDLLDHVWPAALGDLDRGSIELRIVQVHHDWVDHPDLEPLQGARVPSTVLRLQMADVPVAVRAEMMRP